MFLILGKHLGRIIMILFFLGFSFSFAYTDNKFNEDKKNFSDWVFRGGKWKTDAIIIWKDGKIIFEDYSLPYHKDKKHRIWSMTKSYLNILVGLAEKKEILNRQDYILNFVDSSWLANGQDKEKIKVDHLLEMSSGLKWNESYVNIFTSDVIDMLYGDSSKNMAWHAFNKPLKTTVGKKFVYSSGTSNLLSSILANALKKKNIQFLDFFENELLNPLNIKNYTFEKDPAGTYIASSYLYFKPKDVLKFGIALLDQYNGTGKLGLPSDWLPYSWSVSNGFNDKDDDTIPGKHWWINYDSRLVKPKKSWPSAPEDLVAALGHSGQMMVISKKNNLVMVRFGDDGALSGIPKDELFKRTFELAAKNYSTEK
jgi:CubicO group peptidase (beta-lactamase class C family)